MSAETSVQPARGSSMLITWRWLMWAVLIFGIAWIYWSRAPVDNIALNNTLAAPMTGFLAPDFTLSDMNGKPVQLSTLRGKPVIVNFWATWCPPCRAEMPAFEQLWQQYDRGDVMVLGVNQAESVGAIKRFEQEIVDMTFPILLDTNAAVSHLYGVRALPTTLFIDANGRVQDVKMGGVDRASLLDGVNRIVGR